MNFYSGWDDGGRRDDRNHEYRTSAQRTHGSGARATQPQAYTSSQGNSRYTDKGTDRRHHVYEYDTVQEQRGGAHYRDPYDYNSSSGGSYAPQRTEQRHRSSQASKQMLYDVYAQNIGMLEKLEERENGEGRTGGHLDGTTSSRTGVSTRSVSHSDPRRYETSHRPQERRDAVGHTGRGLGRSDVTLPDQSGKTERDLKAVMEGELACLQAQLRFCPPEIRDQTRDELVEKTLGWMAKREEKGTKTGMVDRYASNLLETLLTGETTLGVRDTGRNRRSSPAGEEAILAGVGALQIGQRYGADQDRRFHDDPNRKARCPKIRTGDKADIYGAKRAIAVNPSLRTHLDGKYWPGNLR
ncbi:uncharacterized protein LOC118412501 [Branchiostoma floridae]|uniref:Uncharacterized protein LOC118412501 n=1 Tax=Branchiostoma floridae TaxID=7739 RepID=A0A9J7KWI2_BRAFL|nr:uncharacterized protein LOC118412501 [Branchiostoma floridae]